MKNIFKYFKGLLIILFIASCNDGIDPITEVIPGADATSPVVVIKAPLEGTKFKVNDPLISVNVEFEVTDDIEVGSVKVLLDDTEIASFNNFIDYRRVLETLTADNVATGQHQIKVVATDLEGKSTKVGTPGFAGTSVVGTNAYKGATDSYLTFPSAGLNLGTEISASFWYKVNNDPDRAGILVMGPTDTANPTAQNNRKNGFRFFRENAGGNQRGCIWHLPFLLPQQLYTLMVF